ncbi:MAG: ROK family protein [Acidimicrobiales bacterium]
MTALAADIGGTHMRVGVVDDDGTVLHRERRRTDHGAPGAAQLAALVDAVLGDVRAGRTAAGASIEVGDDADLIIGAPGRIDHRDGRLETAANIPDTWIAEFHEDLLSERLGRRCHLANDADLAAVGETWFGAGRGHDDVLYVTISTGIGAGLVLGRRLVHGRRSGGEIGHTVVDFDGSIDGAPQTVEQLGSGTALGRAAAEAGLPGGAALAALVRDGDPDATAVWHRVVRVAAIGVSNLVWIAAPAAVVIGGGFGRNGDLVLEPIRQTICEVGPADLVEDLVIVEAALGDDAGLAGAAAWTEARAL